MTHSYDFDTLPDRRGTNCVKWDALCQNPDAIPMFVADMDFFSPPCVVDALKKRAEQAVFGYTLLGDDYRDAFLDWERDLHHVTVSKEELSLVPGVITALSWAMHALCREGEGCILSTPSYGPFFTTPRSWGMQLQLNPLRNENGHYEIDWASFEALAADPNNTAFILCNPHNPTGRVWSREELVRLLTICAEHEVFVFADEIHGDIVLPDVPFTSVLALPDELLARTVVLNAPSKTFNLPGLQTSNMIIRNPAVRNRVAAQLTAHHVSTPNLMGLVGGAAAYRDGRAWREEMITYLDENFDFLAEFLKTRLPQVHFQKPGATYLAWLDFREMGLHPAQLEERLLKAGVYLGAGTGYGEDGAGFMRLTAACPRKTLAEALERMAAAF